MAKKKNKITEPAAAFPGSTAQQNLVNNDHQGYFNALVGHAGVDPTAESPFHTWLQTSAFNKIEEGYNRARMTGDPTTSFMDHMAGQGASLTGARGGGAGAGINTGNAFTSSSMGAPTGGVGVQIDQSGNIPGRKGKGKGKNKGGAAAPSSPVATPAVAAGGPPSIEQWMDKQRYAFNSLTPEQQGTANAATQRAPARWAVY